MLPVEITRAPQINDAFQHRLGQVRGSHFITRPRDRNQVRTGKQSRGFAHGVDLFERFSRHNKEQFGPASVRPPSAVRRFQTSKLIGRFKLDSRDAHARSSESPAPPSHTGKHRRSIARLVRRPVRRNQQHSVSSNSRETARDFDMTVVHRIESSAVCSNPPGTHIDGLRVPESAGGPVAGSCSPQ